MRSTDRFCVAKGLIMMDSTPGEAACRSLA